MANTFPVTFTDKIIVFFARLDVKEIESLMNADAIRTVYCLLQLDAAL